MAAKTAAPPKDPEQTEIDDGEFKIPRDKRSREPPIGTATFATSAWN
jgi:hypothetical protein